MDLVDIANQNFHMTWGTFRASTESTLTEHFDTASVVSHFQLSAPTNVKEFCVYHQQPKKYTHDIPKTKSGQKSQFFEVAIELSFFEKIYTPDSRFLDTMHKQLLLTTSTASPFRATITPAMKALISDIGTHNYKGHLMSVYLEIKTMELFLMQIQEMDRQTSLKKCQLSSYDVACLHDAKNFIEQHFNQSISIVGLAQQVGINQTKLKAGFKELFGNTVFGFIRDLQMEKARHLLLDEKRYVGEVADIVGYKHAHHFAAAFKRKYGILPSELKSNYCHTNR
ncbi:helix-turn-helix transcriptional regulator [Sphingobacterium haloxyli]|nr:AraC family transcriptional regulator [Sphingobacterium haloxyli]